MPSFRSAFFPVLGLLAVFSAGFVSGQVPLPIRIMPMGDSITVGAGGTTNLGGYRGPLFTLLTNAGYNPDFVGTQTTNSSSLTDQNHQGHSGWRIDQLDANVATWFASIEEPDVILLHIGTNDFGGNFNITTAIDRLDALILKMATLRPQANIIVTNLMERGETANTSIQTLFNPFVQEVVNEHATAGRKVTFLDMRSAVPLADMPDSLHPNQTGYDKMAAAWLPAIQAVISPSGDNYPPAVGRVLGGEDRRSVTLSFTKPLADTAGDLANYAIEGLNIVSATLSADKRRVTLVTDLQVQGTVYTIRLNNIQDRLVTPLPLPANTTVTFKARLPRGYASNVPESAEYTLLQNLPLPSTATYGVNDPAYTVDNRAVLGGYDRVAYYLELERPDGEFEYVWVSMNAFTPNINQLGVPTFKSEAVFEQSLMNLNVTSNVPGVQQGEGMVGNIEFWPANYSAPANSGIGGSGTFYDFDDTRGTTGTYGSMQIHNSLGQQTVFAINNWGAVTAGSSLDIGIGNRPNPNNLSTVNPDWTFTNNGGDYTARTLQVLVRASGDREAPLLSAATASGDGSRIYLSFNEPVAVQTVIPANFSLSEDVQVLSATLAENRRDVVLVTSQQPSGVMLLLTVSGIRDTSPSANLIVTTVVGVATSALPPEVVAVAGAATTGYQLVYTVDLPQTGNLNALGSAAYSWNDSAATNPFSRVAYFLELQKPGAAAEYVWVAMDAFTQDRKKIGVPTVASGAVFQRNVSNMQVISNVAGVANGSSIATGNIEFWPTDYAVTNELVVPNASETNFDFGDSRKTTGAFGCMQVHNYGASQTVFGINHWGADGNVLDLGIGNNPAAGTGTDWTNAANAGLYYKKRLHVMVLPAVPVLPAEVAANVPEAAGYQLVYSLNIPEQGNLATPAYTTNNSTQVGPFSRIAYYVQLRTGTATPEFVWVSMDAYTTDATKIGVPTAASGAIHQRVLNRMNVVSNKAGIVTGTGIATGNMEFWPNSYTATTSQNLPGGSSTNFDFDDTRNTSGNYGSMQIHNYGAAQTLFALNNWGNAASTTNRFGLGIGNCPAPVSSGLDWTHTLNSHVYSSRVMHVFVLPGDPDIAGPVPLHAAGSTSLDRLLVTFNEPVSAASADLANFSIPGLTIQSAELLSGGREITLHTSAQTPGTVYTVGITGVKDATRAGNPIAAGASVSFTGYQLPALIASIPEASGYELAYQVAIPVARPQWAINPVPYRVNEPRFGDKIFDRVAYVMELDSNWVFVSFDRHTDVFSKVGIPTPAVTKLPFQQLVSNMTVASNVEGIVTGDFATGGNIEFWSGNYSGANALNIPNATSVYDWGDTMSAGAHACMQVHNHAQQQTLFAYNNWGSNAGASSDLGIGNCPVPVSNGNDWTFAGNTGTYTTRNLYVLVRPGGSPPVGGPEILVQPASRSVIPGQNVTFGVTLRNSASLTRFQWRFNGIPIPDATLPWLDLPNIAREDRGSYDVVLTGENNATTVSSAAVLSVFNHQPVFDGYAFTARANAATTLAVATLLTRSSDGDGDPLTVTLSSQATSAGGSISLADGALTYVPPTDFLGADSFGVMFADGYGGVVTGSVGVRVIGLALPSEGNASLQLRADGKMDVAFRDQPGLEYEVQRSTLLESDSWQLVGTAIAGDDGIVFIVDDAPPAGKGFYRLVPTSPPE